MLRAILFALLSITACSVEPPPDLVIYHAAPRTLPDGETQTRSLLVTGARRVLALDRSPAGVVVRTGTAGSAYESLRTALSRARHLPKDTADRELAVATFQVQAVLGGVSVALTRDPARRLEPDVAQAVDDLEAIWESTVPADDVVAAVQPFLASPLSRVRGQGALCLLKVRGDERASDEVRSAAEAALRAHLEVEDDRGIVHGIRDVIDQPDEE